MHSDVSFIVLSDEQRLGELSISKGTIDCELDCCDQRQLTSRHRPSETVGHDAEPSLPALEALWVLATWTRCSAGRSKEAQSSFVATALGVTFIFGSYSATSTTRPALR